MMLSGAGHKGEGNLVFNGYKKFELCKMKIVMEMDGG